MKKFNHILLAIIMIFSIGANARVINLNHITADICQLQLGYSDYAVVDYSFKGCAHQADYWPKYQAEAAASSFPKTIFYQLSINMPKNSSKRLMILKEVQKCLHIDGEVSPMTVVYKKSSMMDSEGGDMDQSTLHDLLVKNLPK